MKIKLLILAALLACCSVASAGTLALELTGTQAEAVAYFKSIANQEPTAVIEVAPGRWHVTGKVKR